MKGDKTYNTEGKNRMIFEKKIYASFYATCLLFISLNCSNSQLNAHNDKYETVYLVPSLSSKELSFHSISNNTKTPNIENYSSPNQCIDQVEVSNSSVLYKKQNIDCVENLIKTCQGSNVHLLYATGSMQLKILGLLNGFCQINISHEIERGSKNYSCAIPSSQLKTWEDWKNGDGLDVLENLTNFCTQK